MPAGAALDWSLQVESTAKLTGLEITIPFGLTDGELTCTRASELLLQRSSGSQLPKASQGDGVKVSFNKRPGEHSPEWKECSAKKTTEKKIQQP